MQDRSILFNFRKRLNSTRNYYYCEKHWPDYQIFNNNWMSLLFIVLTLHACCWRFSSVWTVIILICWIFKFFISIYQCQENKLGEKKNRCIMTLWVCIAVGCSQSAQSKIKKHRGDAYILISINTIDKEKDIKIKKRIHHNSYSYRITLT